MSYLERALKDKHVQITGEGKQQKITYTTVNWTGRYNECCPILLYADLLMTTDDRNLETAELVYEQHLARLLR